MNNAAINVTLEGLTPLESNVLAILPSDPLQAHPSHARVSARREA
jgi:hypothetical protein